MNRQHISAKLSGVLQVSRRDFLSGCAACVLCGPALARGVASAATVPQLAAADEKAKIRLVFTHISPEEETWPYQGNDYEARSQALTARLPKGRPNVEFLPATAQSAGEAKKLLEADRDPGEVAKAIQEVFRDQGALGQRRRGQRSVCQRRPCEGEGLGRTLDQRGATSG